MGQTENSTNWETHKATNILVIKYKNIHSKIIANLPGNIKQ